MAEQLPGGGAAAAPALRSAVRGRLVPLRCPPMSPSASPRLDPLISCGSSTSTMRASSSWSDRARRSARARAGAARRAASQAEKAGSAQIADTDPLTGLANRRAFLAALGSARPRPPRRRLRARHGRPRRLQADQRHVRPCRRRPGARRGGARLAAKPAAARWSRASAATNSRLILPVRNDAAASGPASRLRRARGAVSGRRARVPDLGLLRGHFARARRLRRRGGAHPRRHRALPRQAERARESPSSRRRSPKSIAAGSRSRRRCAPQRDRADRPRLPADHRSRHRRIEGARGAGALAPTDARPDPPDQFIPIAEQINVIEPISDAARARRAEAARWASAVRLSFNVSAVQLCTTGRPRASSPCSSAPASSRPTPGRGDRDRYARRFRVARENLERCGVPGPGSSRRFGAGLASISYLREMIRRVSWTAH